jgi:hypothetical protein
VPENPNLEKLSPTRKARQQHSGEKPDRQKKKKNIKPTSEWEAEKLAPGP